MLTAQAAVNAVVMRTFLTASVHILRTPAPMHRPRPLSLGNRDQTDSIRNQAWVGSFLVPSLDCF